MCTPHPAPVEVTILVRHCCCLTTGWQNKQGLHNGGKKNKKIKEINESQNVINCLRLGLAFASKFAS
jgi:hypothetical protein